MVVLWWNRGESWLVTAHPGSGICCNSFGIVVGLNGVTFIADFVLIGKEANRVSENGEEHPISETVTEFQGGS